MLDIPEPYEPKCSDKCKKLVDTLINDVTIEEAQEASEYLQSCISHARSEAMKNVKMSDYNKLAPSHETIESENSDD